MGFDARRRLAVAVVLVGFLIGSMPSSGAFGADGDEASLEQYEVITNEEAVRQDAVAYSAEFDVSVEEAIHRLDIQVALSDVVTEIEKASAGRFAGGWIEHTPKFRGVVSLTGDGRRWT